MTPGWLVPCELSGSLAGTGYFAFATEDAARLAARMLMKETVADGEVGDSLKELIAQAVAGLSQNAPFTGLAVSVGKPVTAPIAPGAASGGFACTPRRDGPGPRRLQLRRWRRRAGARADRDDGCSRGIAARRARARGSPTTSS